MPRTYRPTGPGTGTALAVILGLAAWAALLLVTPWRAAHVLAVVLLALAVWLLFAFLTGPARARRRRQRAAWAEVTAGTRALFGRDASRAGEDR
ncbi:hypothetical protein NSA53_11135 [Cellulosimicrobium cellulans]|uniref:hypothetical protein n=1 Tax=Cellulosimicrobium cellulans TaxID=1710 RepID=UPI00214A2645|nr:hypothetical protein [Cellulosimicrobium cellulans]